MNKEQAINLIDKALSQIQTNRETHIAFQEALQVIKSLKEAPIDAPEKK